MIIQSRYFGYNYGNLSDNREGKHDYPEHIHHFLEVVCVLEGEIEITVNGVTELARAGDIAVVFPFQVHSQHTPEYCKIWIGLISLAYVTDILSWNSHRVPQKNVFTPAPSAFAYVKEMLPPSYWNRSVSRKRFRHTKALYYVILEEFLRRVDLKTSGINTDALAATYLYVSEHYLENDLTLKKVAAEIGYTPNYISSCLSEIPDVNFRSILNSARVDHAQRLLVSTDMKIADIALESGFSSENVFYSIFEKHVGKTPRQFRMFKKNYT